MFGSREGFGGPADAAEWQAPVETPKTPERHEVTEEEAIPVIGKSEYEIRADRSSGPGGQGVNTSDSKVTLRFCVAKSTSLSERQKDMIREYMGDGLTDDDEIVIQAQTERSQIQNRADAADRLQHLIEKACTPRKKRIATKVGKKQKEKRLNSKHHESDKKKNRQKVDWRRDAE